MTEWRKVSSIHLMSTCLAKTRLPWPTMPHVNNDQQSGMSRPQALNTNIHVLDLIMGLYPQGNQEKVRNAIWEFEPRKNFEAMVKL